jgi:phosphohistidine phosphatase
MKVYFVRHADADWPDWIKPDDERPLTKKGKKQARRVGRRLCELGVEPAFAFTSPLPRAAQTAEIVAKRLCLEAEEEPALGKGFDLAALRKILQRAEGWNLMIVGHEPDFSAVIRKLTGGNVKLAKGGVARVDLESATSAKGTLVWLITPKIAKR